MSHHFAQMRKDESLSQSGVRFKHSLIILIGSQTFAVACVACGNGYTVRTFGFTQHPHRLARCSEGKRDRLPGVGRKLDPKWLSKARERWVGVGLCCAS